MPCHVMRICICMGAWHGRTLMKDEVSIGFAVAGSSREEGVPRMGTALLSASLFP
jgi:hypothetical protein